MMSPRVEKYMILDKYMIDDEMDMNEESNKEDIYILDDTILNEIKHQKAMEEKKNNKKNELIKQIANLQKELEHL